MPVSGHYRICRVPVFAGASWSLVRSLAQAVCLVGCSSGINNYLEAPDKGHRGFPKLTLAEAGISRIFLTDNGGGISRREDETVTQITPGGDPAFSLLAPTGGPSGLREAGGPAERGGHRHRWAQ